MNKEINYQPNIKEVALKGDIILATKLSMDLLDQKIVKIEEEILQTVKDMGESANSDPDLRENYGFRDLRLKASDELPKKIYDLKTKKTKIVEFKDNDSVDGQINFGDKFTVEIFYPNEKEGETFSFQLLGPLETEFNELRGEQDKDLQIISYLSPLGKTIWGHSYKENPICFYNTPAGATKCVILSKI